jgi:phosphate transport system permease protein
MDSKDSKLHSDRPKGESLVWLCSAGLALGVLMVVSLLGLIFWEGITVFWPKSVVQITLKENSQAKLGQERTIAGVVVKKQRNSRNGTEEWQLLTGNKDAYGAMFKYVDTADFVSVENPEGIVVAERMEYGNSIFFPVAYTKHTGERVTIGDPRFWDTFSQGIDEVRQRYKAITDLEKNKIGRINRQVNALTIAKRNYERQLAEGEHVPDDEIRQVEEKLSALQKAFEELAAKARELRHLQEVEMLEYRLSIPDGAST